MAFEVRKGRSCDSLQVLNERLIQSQGVQLINYDKALKLSESKSTTLENLLSNSKEQGRVYKMQADLNLNNEKKKTKKWKKITVTVILIWVAKEGLNALN